MSYLALIIYILILMSITLGPILCYRKQAMYSMVLVLFNFVIYIVMFIVIYNDPSLRFDIWKEFGFSANYLIGKDSFYSVFSQVRVSTIFTHMFIHSYSNPLHILSNMFFLFLLGVPFESKIGPWLFMAVYFIAGLFASIFSGIFSIYAGGFFALNPAYIGIGASGAIFGVLGAFVSTYPGEKILFPLIIIRKYPVWVIGAIYFFVETLIAISGPSDHVGHFAHIGGFIGGLFFAPVIKRLKISHDETRALDTLDFEFLEKYAENYKQKDMLDKIKKETEPQIRQIWLEEYMKSITCPECGSELVVKPHVAKCKCGFKLKY